ncbi:MAG: tRNA1(Val) (adenine(37)-N6)-methyltransferase [Ruminococcaceae bacterium]|nr:tRNA1(Val) (adenine(37)-N6)-methyltransferase [Oscillospiraceae bacterium]
MILPQERLDDLQINNLKLIQNPDWFCFGVDAVLLSDFAKKGIKKGAKILDLCSGNGIIPVLLTAKTENTHITGLEIQSEVAEMANRSVLLNKIKDRVTMLCGDLKNSIELFGKSVFDAITCNPPYKENHGGLQNKTDNLTIARHEILCSLEDIINVSGTLLKPGGKLFMIHRPERLADILCLMRSCKIEPKRLRFVHPSPSKTATMILVEGARQGNPKLFLDPPLYVHDEKGNYTNEINEIYGRNK